MIKLLDIVRDPISHIPALVFEYIENRDFKGFFPQLSDFDVRFYVYEILKTLDYANSYGIMHRDIKPDNIVIDDITKTLRLIDWGLSDYYIPNTNYSVNVQSRENVSPEVLLNYTYYDYSLDIFSVGTVFASMVYNLFYIDRFFRLEIIYYLLFAPVISTNWIINFSQNNLQKVAPKFRSGIYHYCFICYLNNTILFFT